jgi:hypothetical protein
MSTLNKGLIGAAKITLIFIVLLVTLFFFYNFIKPTTASEVSPAIWTADPNGEPKTDFSPEETVYVSGEGFLADTNVNISVTRPDGVVDTGSELTDPYGTFEYEYTLDGITGTYDIFATDGINTATTTFNDSAGAIWTTKNDCGDEQQDINHYNIGEHVYINGAGFDKGTKSWSIKGLPGSCDSNLVVALGNVKIDDSGSFCFDAYTVQEGDCGVYQVKVDKKGDNYQVGDWCDKRTTEKKCDDAGCLWCKQCKYDVSTTKTNQWLTGSCVLPGTDCGWHCEKGYCDATCSNGLDCSCPKDGCVGNDYYDYPLNGTCKDCTTSCYCENGTGSGQTCHPTIIRNDPRCVSCDKYTSESNCNANTNCHWCSKCENPVIPTKVNQWLQAKCVPKTTDCGWHCEIGQCGATCSLDTQCFCKADYCDGTTYVDYPDHGDCVYCPTSCYCQNGTNVGQPCHPTFYPNDPRCGECKTDDDCNKLDKDYCDGTVIKHDEGKCVNYFCKVETTIIQDCNDGLYCNGQETCLNAACVAGNPIDCSYLCDKCQEGKCDEALDKCVADYSKFPLSTPCELDDNKCTIDHCDGFGKCVWNYDVNCDDSNVCTQDSCDSVLGCLHKTVSCDDGDVCTLDSCDPITGCIHTPISNCCKTDSDCNDSNACTNDVCVSNHCQHTSVTCNDGVGCTEDSCDTVKGCIYKPNDGKCPSDTTCSDYYCDAKLDCQANYAPLSTPCEADSSKCTIDHCNGSGSCIFKENVIVPPAQQCKSFYCNPSDGKIKENYTAYPLSTPCNADDKFCTVDHCNGSGSCVYWKDYDCSGYDLKEIAQCNWIPDGFTYTFDYSPGFKSVCDETLDKCTEGSHTFTHTCADANASDGGPVIPVGNGVRTCDAECDGFGIECQNKCIGDIRYYDGNCDLIGCSCSYQSEDCNKDGCYVYGNGCEQRDYYCTVDGCKYDYSGRHTDYNDDFVNYCSDSTVRKHRTFHDFYCNGACSDHTSWIDDQLIENCDLKDGWYDTGKTQWLPVGECADKEQKEQEYRDYTCKDAACDYKVTNYQWVDTGKIKNKELSTPCEADGSKCTIDHCDGSGQCVKKEDVDCSTLTNKCQEGVCNPSDGKCYPDYTKFPLSTPCEADDDKCTIDHCDGKGNCIFKENVPVPPAEECKSFYCDSKDGKVKENYTDFPLSTLCPSGDVCKINHCDGLGECVFWKDVPIPSKPIKTIGDPKTKCNEGEWCEWRITTLTPITLTCEEGKIYWRYALDGEWKEWNDDGSSVTIYFPEESNHTLEAYCLNDCDESEHDIEKFKVEGTAFEIPLYKKWNLISVPFVLLNGTVSEVFKNISDYIVSVWTYDNGNWYSWSPNLGGTLTDIKPGWGYWVITNNDTKLLISGNLLSPITTPPSKNLQEGWNLIGYYGTEWQTYELEKDSECGYVNYNYGNYVYCSLNSLIDTQQGFPRWSSLWGYDNCGNDKAYWHDLESCLNGYWKDIKMFAGKGYWIEMDVKDSYAPATNCIWDKDFKCSLPSL